MGADVERAADDLELAQREPDLGRIHGRARARVATSDRCNRSGRRGRDGRDGQCEKDQQTAHAGAGVYFLVPAFVLVSSFIAAACCFAVQGGTTPFMRA